MSAHPVDVLARMDAWGDLLESKVRTDAARLDAMLREVTEVRAAVTELVEADKEYDAANRDWEHFTSADPDSFTAEQWAKVADRFEAALMRRIAALARMEPQS